MLLRSVTLENVKSYRSATILFQPGTNAISGENGAGKSTILEAIGYALFDYNPYNIRNLVRHGEKTGKIIIHLTGVDDRDYEILRTFGGTSKYLVLDKETGAKIVDSKTDGKEGVQKALRKDILGIGEDADLTKLFEDVIGVPQGSIMTPFLETANARKMKFDPVLGIEEYKKAHEDTRQIQIVIERKISDLREEIKYISGRLESLPDKVLEFDQNNEQIMKLGTVVVQLNGKLSRLKERQIELEKLEYSIRRFKETIGRTEVALKQQNVRLTSMKGDLGNALTARKIITASVEGHKKYLEMKEQLSDLERKRKHRDHLKEVISELEKKGEGLKEKQRNLDRELGKIDAAEKELPSVQEKLGIQKQLEKEKNELEQAFIRGKEKKRRLSEIEIDEKNTLSRLAGLEEKIGKKEQLEREVQELSSLERRHEVLKTRESTLIAEIHHLQSNKEALSTGNCPFFREACPLVEGDAETVFSGKLKEDGASLDKVRGTIATLETSIRKTKEFEKELQKLELSQPHMETEFRRLSEIQEKIKVLKSELSSTPSEQQIIDIQKKLTSNGDHHGPYHTLSQLVKDRPKKEQEIQQNTMEMKTITVSIAVKNTELDSFGDLDKQYNDLNDQAKIYSKDHDNYTKNKKESEKVEEITSNIETLNHEMQKDRTLLENTREQLLNIEAQFDADELKITKKQTVELTGKIGMHTGELKVMKKKAIDLEIEIRKLNEQSVKRESREKELAVEERSEQIISYIRDLFRKIPEYLRKRYVSVISQDANNRFHELIGDNSLDISWEEDFGITMRKGKDETVFKLLSGGQQMSAALAVRLALIRRFSGLRLAFFDEPTHNLDEERRENLANSFFRITGFDQLFVISHDETFNSVIENNIEIRMENGESIIS